MFLLLVSACGEDDPVNSTPEPSGLLAYEGFAYPAAASVGGSDGGSGWASAWGEYLGTGATVLASGLVPTGASAALQGSGLAVQNNLNSRVGRFLDTTASGPFAPYLDENGNIGATGTTLYVSFLQQAAVTTRFWEFEFHRDNLTDPGRIAGIGNESVDSVVSLRAPNGTTNSLGASDTAVNFWVVRIDFKEGLDDISVFKNPALGTEPVAPTLFLEGQADLSFNGISFGCWTFEEEGRASHDELRIGSSYAAVTP